MTHQTAEQHSVSDKQPKQAASKNEKDTGWFNLNICFYSKGST
jgi:hypothetical protein